jgi:glutathione synthase/RimK-type ligase-like ATP-grasp enzyme
MPNTVLIVTNKIDPHVDLVLSKLQEQKVSCFRWNLEDFPSAHHILMNVTASGSLGAANIFAEHRKLQLADVKVAWYRRPGDSTVSSSISDEIDRQLAQRETDFFLRGLWLTLKSEWINAPHLIHSAGYKVGQLGIAGSVGLRVPATLLTNDFQEVQEFARRHRNCIIKPISGGFVVRDSEHRHIYCNLIEAAEIEPTDLAACPILLQENISKRIELRVTIVGESVFTCAIDSQSSDRTMTDWRRYDFPNVRHFRYELPEDICARLKSILREYQLSFGAFDLILTPEGEYVFLELNPNGQWLWIEELTGLPISDSVVALIKTKLSS